MSHINDMLRGRLHLMSEEVSQELTAVQSQPKEAYNALYVVQEIFFVLSQKQK